MILDIVYKASTVEMDYARFVVFTIWAIIGLISILRLLVKVMK